MKKLDGVKVVMDPRWPKRQKRGPYRYWDLFVEVQEDYPFGTWVCLLEYKTREQAYRVRGWMWDGKYELPGGTDAWELEVEVEYKRVGTVKASRLFVRRVS